VEGFDIGQSFQDGVSRIFEYLPQLLAALLILAVGYIVSVVIKNIIRKALLKLRFDRSLQTSPAGKYIDRIVESPSSLVARVVFWFAWIGFISLAVSVLNLEALNDFVAAIYGYLPNVLAALLIFLVASAVSGATVAFVRKVMGKSPTSSTIQAVIPAITMSVAVFMILSQLGIATDIVNITYAAIMGSLALGLALAFGLGGRDVAARMLEQAYESGLKNADTIKSDLERAKQNTKAEARKARKQN